VNNAANSSGTVPVDTTGYTINSEVVLSTQGNLQKPNNVFQGWSLNSSGSGTLNVAGSTYIIQSNVTFYAVWAVRYTVTYVNNYSDAGGNVPVETNTFPSGTLYTVLGGGTMVRNNNPNATFDGWYTDSTLKKTKYTSAGPTYTITKNITFYAKFI
jgi:uncharacterized repeat protein (TIGR02543 family)